MNKKGFTLIELLLVITIVCALGASTMIMFQQISDNTKTSDAKQLYISVQSSALLYVDLNDDKANLLYNNGTLSINISDLKTANYIDAKTKDPSTRNNLDGRIIVFIAPACMTESPSVDIGSHVETCLCLDNNKAYDHNGVESFIDSSNDELLGCTDSSYLSNSDNCYNRCN